jgi:sulfur-oxidizing protein SoxX
LLLASAAGAGDSRLVPYEIVGDAIPQSLTGGKGDPLRGRAIVVNRQAGLCLLCHTGPFAEERLPGSIAPDLAGANPNTIMPPYYRNEGLARVAPAYAGKPILSAGQVEDVVAFLATLTE